MAIDFPNSPTVDDIFTVAEKSWIWDGSAWKVYFSPPVMYVQDTPPSVPKTGDQWYESDTGQHFVYYDSIWVETGSAITTNVNAGDLSGTQLTDGIVGSADMVIQMQVFSQEINNGYIYKKGFEWFY